MASKDAATEEAPKVAEDEIKDKKEDAAAPVSKEEDSTEVKSEEKQEVVPPKEEDLYDDELPGRIIVGRNHPLSFYVDRARRVFRVESEVYITGRGDNISTVCKLVETLKRQKIATISKISTGMNVVPYFNAYGDARWGQPTAVILFTLLRGELGEFISDYSQRKVIEIFENNDEKQTGAIPMDKVNALQMDKKFKANDKQIEKSKQFLSDLGDSIQNDGLDLPAFIKYASILIHPLLKNRVFKEILNKEFGIEVSGIQRNTNA